MKVVACSNAFKECLSADEACQAMRNGVLMCSEELEVVVCPLADGGDSSLEVLAGGGRGELVEVNNVEDPLGRPITAAYGLIHEGKTAVIEMARCSGLALLTAAEKDPTKTTTAGVGDLILDALSRGTTTVILCIGGSATNDMGTGMADRLGLAFYDSSGEPITRPAGADLSRVARVSDDNADPRLKGTKFLVACDVTNPLTGHTGATYTYGRQKGATDAMLAQLEEGMINMAKVVDCDVEFKGAGAAGGLGAGCVAFLGAEIRTGFDVCAEAAGLHSALQGADLVITGEGQIDEQTVSGKVVSGVAVLCASLPAPPHVAVVAGSVANAQLIRASCTPLARASLFSLCNGPMPLEAAMHQATAASLIAEAACNITNVFKSARSLPVGPRP